MSDAKSVHVQIPAGGEKITIADGKLLVPDQAIIREVLEETGVTIKLLVSDTLEYQPETELPRQLTRPRGVQLEHIAQDHEHIDLIYFAVPLPNYDGLISSEDNPFIWCNLEKLTALPLGNEVRAWCELALKEVL